MVRLGIFQKYQDWHGRFEGVLNKKWQRIIDVQCLDSPYKAINDVKTCKLKGNLDIYVVY